MEDDTVIFTIRFERIGGLGFLDPFAMCIHCAFYG
jgi:hypothetical protein